MQCIKLHLVGDGGIGKTCLLISYTTNAFPGAYIPTMFDNYSANVMLDKKVYNLCLWDIAGGEDYMRLRALGYPYTDVFVFCYAIDRPSSFQNITEKWIPEIFQHCPGTPFMIVGTKEDLRKDEDKKGKLIDANDAIRLARKVGAAGYCECSALTLTNVRGVFDIGIRIYQDYMRMKPKKVKKSISQIMREGIKNINVAPRRITPGEEPVHMTPIAPHAYPVFGHTSVVVGTKVFMIGGSDSKAEFYRSIRAVDTKYGTLDILEEFGELPLLQFHTCVADELNLYTFGGKSNGYRNDIYRINLETHRVEKLETQGTAPSPRYGHSAVVWRGKMIIFGGYDNSALTCNDLFSYTFETNKWEKIQVQGTVPPSRFMHTAVIRDNEMHVFGGQGDNSIILNDSYQFDFELSIWTKLKTKGKIPSPRCGHSSTATVTGMYVFGGFDKTKNKFYSDLSLRDFSSKEWFSTPVVAAYAMNESEKEKGKQKEKGKENKDKVLLTGRFNHSCAWDPVNKVMIISGGKDESDVLSDIFLLGHLLPFVETMPRHIMVHIMMFLSLKEVSVARSVCKRLTVICDDDELWIYFCQKLLKTYDKMDVAEGKTHKEHFIESKPMYVSVPSMK